jgi:hypothetical protein
MKKVLLLVSAIVAIVSCLVMAVPALAYDSSADPPYGPGNQSWYLLDEAHQYNASDFAMQRGVTPSVTNLPIASGATLTWLADEAAVPVTGVTFAPGDWSLELTSVKLTGNQSKWADYCVVDVGEYNPIGNIYTSFGLSFTKVINSTSSIIKVGSQTATALTVAQGCYLYLRITNASTTVGQTIVLGAGSRLNSTEGDPGYPLPEIAAGILLGGGLIGLVAFVAIRKKKVSIVS